MCQPCKEGQHQVCEDLTMDRYAPSCFCQCMTAQNPAGKRATMAAKATERAAAATAAGSNRQAAHELVRPIARLRGEGTGGRGGWAYVAVCTCGDDSGHKSHEQNAELWHEDHARVEAEVERRTLPLEAGGYL